MIGREVEGEIQQTRQVTNKQTRPFQRMKNGMKEIKQDNRLFNL